MLCAMSSYVVGLAFPEVGWLHATSMSYRIRVQGLSYGDAHGLRGWPEVGTVGVFGESRPFGLGKEAAGPSVTTS